MKKLRRKRRKANVYPPPFGLEAECICSDAWRSTRPRNHAEYCERAFENRRALGYVQKMITP